MTTYQSQSTRSRQLFSTLAAVTASNPVLLEGEKWNEKDAVTGLFTGRTKTGKDGVVSGSPPNQTITGTAFNSLPFDPGNAGGGSGDVVGPASATDGRAALFDGATGKLLKVASAAPVLEGDARLSDARPPTAHAASHGTGGADAITVAQGQVTGLATALAGKETAGAATAAVAAHEGAADPHAQYLTQTEGDGRYRQTATALTDSDIPAGIARDAEVTAAIAAHEGAADPHPNYLTAAEGNAAYATAAAGVTNGNSHDHNGGDGAQIAYGSLSGLPTLPTGTNTGDQSIANTSDATSHTVTLSASGGSMQLREGSNITLTTTGTSGAAVVTIACIVSGGGDDFRYFDAAEFIPRTTNGCGVSSDETATNRVNCDLLMFDPGAQEFAQKRFAWPTGWNTFSVAFAWKYSSGSGNCVWGARARLYADNTAQDSAFGTAQIVTDNGLGTGVYHESAATPAITPSGTVADGRSFVLEIYRDATNGSDTLGVDGELISVLLTKVT
jgi:hypothetical protein